jgi:hypothetical protein
MDDHIGPLEAFYGLAEENVGDVTASRTKGSAWSVSALVAQR